MDWLLAETPYHSPYFAQRKCLGLARGLLFPHPGTRISIQASYTTPTRKAKNGKLLSGHTNTENKVLSFSYAHKEIASTTLVPYTYTYRANSTYDPDPALGGTSAYGHSHMGARYQKYYVKSARMQMIAGGHQH